MTLARWLPVHKPEAHTSHDVVAIARRRLWFKKIGHTGTLDPDATGVLVLALGKATRLIQYLQGGKTYRARILLGRTTDSYDLSGQTLSEAPVPELSRSELDALLSAFRGVQEQLPPMVSAVSYQGQRLYKLARQGIEVADRPRRQIEIYRLELLDFAAPELWLEVACSAGTYIRTLAHDLGQKLGCGAVLSELERSAAHQVFGLQDCLKLEDLQPLTERPAPGFAADWPLQHLPALTLEDPEQVWRFCQGQKQALELPFAAGQILRLYRPSDTENGEFLALAEYTGTVLKSRLLIAQPEF